MQQDIGDKMAKKMPRDSPPGLGLSLWLQGHLVAVNEQRRSIHGHVGQDLSDHIQASVGLCLLHHVAHRATRVLEAGVRGRQELIGEGQCLRRSTAESARCQNLAVEL